MGNIDELYINVPSLFRCPISLDVMNSPVSLCTGVTYDRASIQRWLDDGNNTCPATMQVLQTKDFVPNYTLQRLIKIWSNNHRQQLNLSSDHPPPPSTPPSPLCSFSISFISDLIEELVVKEKEKCQNESVLFESFAKILCFASERDDNRRFLDSNEEFVGYLTRLVCSFREGLGCVNPDLLETALKILQLIISLNDNDNDNYKRRKKLISSCDLVRLLTRVFKVGRPGSRVAAARIIETFAQDPRWSKSVFDRQELVFELLHVLKEEKSKISSLFDDSEIRMDVIRAVLSCLISLSSTRTNKKQLIRVGGVKIIGEMMISASSPHNKNVNDEYVVINELLLTLLEMLAGLTEGRTAINDEQCLVSVIIINKLMKVSKAVNEHGVSLLWSLCYLYRDKRVKDAVMRSNGLTKILVLMQSDCSPAAKKMCCDLLRIFRVNSKSCLSSYDTKTTHIMPC